MVNFDELIDRYDTNCVKWDTINETYGESDLLPLWVADMDFKANPPVIDALTSVLKQGILGYYSIPDSLYEAIQAWQERHHDLILEKEAILFNSGVVPSINLAVQAFTQPGDAVMIHDPVYSPFSTVVKLNDRKLVRNTLLNTNGHFEIDFTTMEQQMIEEQVKLFIFCNPHNPGGRVWTKNELETFGKLCQKHNVLVVSDEIHQDLVFAPNVFTTFSKAHPSFKDFSITLTSATKTFNLAGIKNSMIFIQNPDLRKTFLAAQERNQQTEINTFGCVGTEAAYRNGDTWLAELLVYIEENITVATDFLEKELPDIQVMKPEGTYLMWLDCSALNLSDKELQDRLIHKGKVVLNSGVSFGPNGTKHVRLNVACPRETLIEGLNRIKQAFSE